MTNTPQQLNCFQLCSLANLTAKHGFDLDEKRASEFVIRRNDKRAEVAKRLGELARHTKQRQSYVSDNQRRVELKKLIDQLERIIAETKDDQTWQSYLERTAPPRLRLSPEQISWSEVRQPSEERRSIVQIISTNTNALDVSITVTQPWIAIDGPAQLRLLPGKPQTIVVRLDHSKISQTGVLAGYIKLTSSDPECETGRLRVQAAIARPVLRCSEPRIELGPLRSAHEAPKRGLTINNAGHYSLTAVIDPADPWITVLPRRVEGLTSGRYQQVSVSVDASKLPATLARVLSSHILLRSNAGELRIPVDLRLDPPVLRVSTSSLSFGEVRAVRDVFAQHLEIENTGGFELRGRVVSSEPWISIKQNTFNVPSHQRHRCSISIRLNAFGSRSGLVNGRLQVINNAGDPQWVVVSVKVIPPFAQLSEKVVDFGKVRRQRNVVTRKLQITNSGGSRLIGQLTPNTNFLSVEPHEIALDAGDSVNVQISLIPRMVQLSDELGDAACTFVSNAGGVQTIEVLGKMRDSWPDWLLQRDFWRTIVGMHHWWAGGLFAALVAAMATLLQAAWFTPRLNLLELPNLRALLVSSCLAAAAGRIYAKVTVRDYFDELELNLAPRTFAWSEIPPMIAFTTAALSALMLAFDITTRPNLFAMAVGGGVLLAVSKFVFTGQYYFGTSLGQFAAALVALAVGRWIFQMAWLPGALAALFGVFLLVYCLVWLLTALLPGDTDYPALASAWALVAGVCYLLVSLLLLAAAFRHFPLF